MALTISFPDKLFNMIVLLGEKPTEHEQMKNFDIATIDFPQGYFSYFCFN